MDPLLMFRNEPEAAVVAAIARTDCRLAVVSEKRFIFLVQNHPFFALHVMRVLAGRLRWADSQLAPEAA